MRYIVNKYIESIYSYTESLSSYGLHLLIKFEDNSSLIFNHGCFHYSTDIQNTSFLFSKWINIRYDKLKDQIQINKIREDENVSYFIEFSNNDILHIYQRIIGNLDNWIQDYEIISKNEIYEYNRVYKYMNENFVEDVLIQ